MGRWPADGIGRPTQVKVLTRVYRIAWLTEDEWYQNRMDDESLAMTERDKSLISIRADATADEETMREVLLHEVLHTTTEASRFSRYIQQVEDAEEFVVSLVSPILLGVLKDNPDLVAYLLIDGALAQTD